jgi:hypothetical protein
MSGLDLVSALWDTFNVSMRKNIGVLSVTYVCFVDICDTNVDFYVVSHCANTSLYENMRHLWNFIFKFVVVFIVSVHCQSVSHVRKLYADLFSNYTTMNTTTNLKIKFHKCLIFSYRDVLAQWLTS